MAGLGDLFQKAVYLGVGLASYTGEKASERLGELRGQAQKLADELVQRGEMTTEEARKMVDDMVQRSQAEATATRTKVQQEPGGPRTIEIEVEDSSGQTTSSTASASTSSSDNSTTAPEDPAKAQAETLRREVAKLQDELQRLRRES